MGLEALLDLEAALLRVLLLQLQRLGSADAVHMLRLASLVRWTAGPPRESRTVEGSVGWMCPSSLSSSSAQSMWVCKPSSQRVAPPRENHVVFGPCTPSPWRKKRCQNSWSQPGTSLRGLAESRKPQPSSSSTPQAGPWIPFLDTMEHATKSHGPLVPRHPLEGSPPPPLGGPDLGPRGAGSLGWPWWRW